MVVGPTIDEGPQSGDDGQRTGFCRIMMVMERDRDYLTWHAARCDIAIGEKDAVMTLCELVRRLRAQG